MNNDFWRTSLHGVVSYSITNSKETKWSSQDCESDHHSHHYRLPGNEPHSTQLKVSQDWQLHTYYLLQPTGYVMHHQFNIQQLVRSAHTVFMCFIFIWGKKNSDLCHLHHKMTGFYNRDEVFTARYELGL